MHFFSTLIFDRNLDFITSTTNLTNKTGLFSAFGFFSFLPPRQGVAMHSLATADLGCKVQDDEMGGGGGGMLGTDHLGNRHVYGRTILKRITKGVVCSLLD
jgi:hypothetical protein